MRRMMLLMTLVLGSSLACSDKGTTSCSGSSCNGGSDTLVLTLRSPLATGDVDTVQAALHHNTVDQVPESLFSLVTWGSTSTSVATVTNGVVTGQGPGTTSITATYQSNQASLPLQVVPDTLTLSTSNSSLTQGQVDTVRITAHHNSSSILPLSLYNQIAWSSNAPSVVSVTNGILNAVGTSGSAKITATYLQASGSVNLSVQAAGSPVPGAGDTVLFDTRAGGAQSIQATSDLASALTATGIVTNATSTGGFTVYPVAFTTNVDGSGTHAFVLQWQLNAGDSACHGNTTSEDNVMIEKGVSSQGGPYVDGEIFLSYKVWYGKTATGGGVGSVGAYSEGGGHKFMVWTRRPFGGGANINDGRYTLEENTHGGTLEVATYTGYSGPPAHTDNNEIAEAFFWGDGNASTCTFCSSGSQWLPSNYYNQANTLAFRLKPESALNAGDGQMEMWANGTVVFDSTSQYTYNGGWASLQIGGPTWICPPQDQTEYVWDIVVWQHKP